MRRWLRVALAFVLLAAGFLAAGPRDSSTASASGDPHFGLDFVSSPGTVAGTTRFAQATATGAGWDRFPFYWSSMQASRDAAIDFGPTDATVNPDLARRPAGP